MTPKNPQVQTTIDQILEHYPLQGKSLIITLFGDMIGPRGGSLWLGSLIKLLSHFNVSQRLVRTSVYRLCEEHWLDNTLIGRRSYYRLTQEGVARCDAAYQRIYRRRPFGWDGLWSVVLTSAQDLNSEMREMLRKELRWMGFGRLTPGVYLHPSIDTGLVRNQIHGLGLADRVLVLRGSPETMTDADTVRRLVARCWNMAGIEKQYHDFIELMQPVWQSVARSRDLNPLQCFVLRTLMIHWFRRLLLKDPQLPGQLLPEQWVGEQASTLCINLYHRLQRPADAFLMSMVETEHGPLPEANRAYYQRFGGLIATTANERIH